MQTQTSMPWVGFEPTILVFEQAKTVHALDCAATVIGTGRINWLKYVYEKETCFDPNGNIWLELPLMSVLLHDNVSVHLLPTADAVEDTWRCCETDSEDLPVCGTDAIAVIMSSHFINLSVNFNFFISVFRFARRWQGILHLSEIWSHVVW
jgi:hypothetical protein